MAKLVAVKGTKANGDKTIMGFSVALQKTEMERCGFKEGDELIVSYRKDEVRIKKK